MRRVDQWVPALHAGDAIGDSALLMRQALRGWGYASDIFTFSWDDDRAASCRPFDSFVEGEPRDVVILHYAIVSPMNEAFTKLHCRRILQHHNLTPYEFLTQWDGEVAKILREGRLGLAPLASTTDLGLGDSEFNRAELMAEGFRRTDVLPIALDFDAYRSEGDKLLTSALRADGRVNLLFVGRVAPNKRHDDLLRVTAYFKRYIDSAVRLLLVGRAPRRETGKGESITAHYLDSLLSLASDLGLNEDDVLFVGGVSHAELLAYYTVADVFVSASEHEGFGVPLVEAMIQGVPIVARGGSAVTGTLGGAGVVIDDRDISALAEGAALLAERGPRRDAVVRAQNERARAFEMATVLARFQSFVESV